MAANNTKTTKVEPKNEEVKKTVTRTVKKFAQDDEIECRSVTGGELIMIGPKTGLRYSWADYGDVTYVEYQDLHALQSRRSNFLLKPRFIIENDDLVEQWSSMLKPLYDNVIEDDISTLFELDLISFKNRLSQLPAGVIDAVKTKAVQMIKNDELYDIRIVRAMDEILGTDFVNTFVK